MSLYWRAYSVCDHPLGKIVEFHRFPSIKNDLDLIWNDRIFEPCNINGSPQKKRDTNHTHPSATFKSFH